MPRQKGIYTFATRARYDSEVVEKGLKDRHPKLHLVVAGLGVCGASHAFAQAVPPFYGGPVTVFDVEIGIIDSATLLDAQAVVSQDRRYVTINAQATNTGLLALQNFQTQKISPAAAGFVGGVNPAGRPAKAPSGNSSPSSSAPLSSAAAIDRAGRDAISVLNQRGIFLIQPITASTK